MLSSAKAEGNLTKNGARFLHNFGTRARSLATPRVPKTWSAAVSEAVSVRAKSSEAKPTPETKPPQQEQS
mgnify:CR=1 FL=1|jgi:hypothetical protein